MIGKLRDHIKRSLEENFKPEKRKRVGGYVIGKVIGEGSFAKVHIGVHLLTKERVAIKVIPKKLVEKRDYIRKNMRREAALLQRLDHPNIARLYEIMETGNSFYIVMELVEGGDMMKYLNDRNGINESEARRFMREIVSAVDHMHRSGVIHRDLKVENLLMNRNKNIKIIDFGLSNFFDGEHLLDTQCGSPAYAAPEIFNMAKYGPGVDVWSLGVNLYAMVTGQLPFTVDPPNNITKLHATILRGCKIPLTISSDCRHLIRGMLEVDDNRRMSVADIMKHPWLNYEYVPLEPWPLRQGIPVSQIDNKVMSYMRDVLSYTESDIITCLATSRPTAIYATYQLLLQRIDKHLDLPVPPTDYWQATSRKDNSQVTTDTIQVTARTDGSQVTPDSFQVTDGTDNIQVTSRTDNSRATPDSIEVTARTDNTQVTAKTDNNQKQVISRIDNRGETIIDNGNITKTPSDAQTLPEVDDTQEISSLSPHQDTLRDNIAGESQHAKDNENSNSQSLVTENRPNPYVKNRIYVNYDSGQGGCHNTPDDYCYPEGTRSMQNIQNYSESEGTSRLHQMQVRKERTDLILARKPRYEPKPDKYSGLESKVAGTKSQQYRIPGVLSNKADPLFLTADEIRHLSDRFLKGHLTYDRFAPGASYLQNDVDGSSKSTTGPASNSCSHSRLDASQQGKPNWLTYRTKLQPLKSSVHYVKNKATPGTKTDKASELQDKTSIKRRAINLPNLAERAEREHENTPTHQASRHHASRMTDSATFTDLGVTYHLPYKKLITTERNTDRISQKQHRKADSKLNKNVVYPKMKSAMPLQQVCRKNVQINAVPVTEPPKAGSTT